MTSTLLSDAFAWLVSLMGYPVNWCIEALNSSNQVLSEAITWLFANEEKLKQEQIAERRVKGRIDDHLVVYTVLTHRRVLAGEQPQAAEEEAKNVREKVGQRRRLKTEASSGSSGGTQEWRILRDTTEPMEISLDTLIKRAKPAVSLSTLLQLRRNSWTELFELSGVHSVLRRSLI